MGVVAKRIQVAEVRQDNHGPSLVFDAKLRQHQAEDSTSSEIR